MINTLTLRLVFAALAAGTGASKVAHLAPKTMAECPSYDFRSSEQIILDARKHREKNPEPIQRAKKLVDVEGKLAKCIRDGKSERTGMQEFRDVPCESSDYASIASELKALIDTGSLRTNDQKYAKTLLEDANYYKDRAAY